MFAMKDKKHWYNGLFYDKLIAPNQDRLFKLIKEFITEQSTVLDVGCGTGRLEFQLSDKCKEITGIDLSSKNISFANKKLEKTNYNNIKFIHCDIKEFKANIKEKYDYAIITYVLHEVDIEQRISILNAMKDIVENIIMGDYLVPVGKDFNAKVSKIVEFVAGKEHYRNYCSYVEQGGLNTLINEAKLHTIKEIRNKPKTSHIIFAQ
jgi:SAM-dependent methyltransferase